MQLLRDVVFRPRRSRQCIHLLERELAHPAGVNEYEPIRLVRCAVRRRFVTGSVGQPQQLAVELGELSRCGGVENGVKQLRILGHNPP